MPHGGPAPQASLSPPEPLPPGAVLLHIGPHKTGTTAIQHSLKAARQELDRHGVCYLGTRRFREQAPLAVLGRRGRPGIRPPREQDWADLVATVEQARGKRVVLSSERYSWATPQRVRAVLETFGGRPVHVVVTLRSIERILASQWQMTVQGGLTTTYAEWLLTILGPGDPPPPAARSFWRRHAHGALVRRWARAAGHQNVTAVVVDDADRMALMNAFAALLGVPEGLLVPVPGKTNRSLTLGEAELLRQVNQAFAANDWSPLDHARVIRDGLAVYLRERDPHPDEPRIATPPWAAELAAERADAAIAQIVASNVRVVGDLERLRVGRADPASAGGPADPAVPAQVGARAVVGVLALERGLRPTTALLPNEN